MSSSTARRPPASWASAPPAWVSELAEELAGLIEEGKDPGTLSVRIREVASTRQIAEPWVLANMVAREWDRLGIRRVPVRFGVGGW